MYAVEEEPRSNDSVRLPKRMAALLLELYAQPPLNVLQLLQQLQEMAPSCTGNMKRPNTSHRSRWKLHVHPKPEESYASALGGEAQDLLLRKTRLAGPVKKPHMSPRIKPGLKPVQWLQISQSLRTKFL